MPISTESKELIKSETFENIKLFTKVVDDIRNYILKIDTTYLQFKSKDDNYKLSDEVVSLLRLNEYILLLGLIWLDITSSVRFSVGAELKYEEIYASKQLVITINEGYKKIYNFVNLKNGKENLDNRDNSFWIKDIGKMVKKNLNQLEIEYDSITSELDKYFVDHFTDIKNQRDLSVHYDNQPSKVYDMLCTLNSDDIFQKVISFINILTKMFSFGKSVLTQYEIFIKNKQNDFLDNYAEKFEILKNHNNKNSEANEFIDLIKKQLIDLKL